MNRELGMSLKGLEESVEGEVIRADVERGLQEG